MSSNREKMTAGELYCCVDDEIVIEQTACLEKLYDYNATRPSEGEKRLKMLTFTSLLFICFIIPVLVNSSMI